jgi:TonB family protein
LSDEQAAVAIMDYYPAAARAAGVSGFAKLLCHRTEHYRLADCTVLSETPAGSGFGAAALTLAGLSKDNPNITITPNPKGDAVTFSFSAKPAWIIPNTLVPLHTVKPSGGWRTVPSAEDIARVYPRAAAARRTGGHVLLACLIAKDGRLPGCDVLDEQPAGLGFGEAALKLRPEFRMSPVLREDGQPDGESLISLPINFRVGS